MTALADIECSRNMKYFYIRQTFIGKKTKVIKFKDKSYLDHDYKMNAKGAFNLPCSRNPSEAMQVLNSWSIKLINRCMHKQQQLRE